MSEEEEVRGAEGTPTERGEAPFVQPEARELLEEIVNENPQEEPI